MADVNTLKEQTQNFANEIWTVADILHGPFNDDEYGEVILPFALLRRFECVLHEKREEVRQASLMLTNIGVTDDDQYSQLCVVSGLPFYNTSKYTLATLGSEHTKDNLIYYKNGFSKNVREIFDHFDFDRICAKLEKHEKTFTVVEFFKKLDLNVKPRAMSNLYEELIWKFADTKHKASKEYLTPRDIVHLATTLVLDSDEEALTSTKGLIRTIYDPTAGTCGFITDAMDFIRDQTADNPLRTELQPAGQEVNDIAWAMGKAMLLLTGCEAPNADAAMRDMSVGLLRGDTLKNDLHISDTYDYVFSNPPFGMDWSDTYDSVKSDPRFAMGLPPKSDGSMLFLAHVTQKMKAPVRDETGKVIQSGHGAIVLSGSPLFTGGAGSGPSEIRRWLFEKDKVEAIIQLPSELFYNTSISSYLWILNSGKPEERKNKTLLIDASSLKTPIRNIGNKRYMISPEQIEQIAVVFRDFVDTDISKVVDYREVGYRAVTIQCPRRIKYVITEDKIKEVMNLSVVKEKLSENARNILRDRLTLRIGEVKANFFDYFTDELKIFKVKLTKPVIKAIDGVLAEEDPTGDICNDSKGNVIFNPESKQVENIPLTTDVETYLNEEVKPFVPDAMVDQTVTDAKDGKAGIVGYEINFNKYFYKYVPPRNPEEIAQEIKALEAETTKLMKELFE